MPEITRGNAPGELVVHDADGSRLGRMFALSVSGTTWVFHNGVTYQLAEQAPPRRRAGTLESLTAPMPATVIQVNVVPGDAVKQGDILVLLEAMKMELPLRAPADGKVAAVHCRAGELVQPGAALIELA